MAQLNRFLFPLEGLSGHNQDPNIALAIKKIHNQFDIDAMVLRVHGEQVKDSLVLNETDGVQGRTLTSIRTLVVRTKYNPGYRVVRESVLQTGPQIDFFGSNGNGWGE